MTGFASCSNAPATPPKPRPPSSPPSLSSAASPAPTTSRSRSAIAASAIPTCTRSATNGPTPSYPCVPGHEIVGEVTRVGKNVTAFKVGDLAGVGCMVDSCRECEACKAGQENYCKPGFTATYNSPGRQERGRPYLRRLLEPHRRRPRLLPAHPEVARPRRRRAAAVRGHHHLLAAAPLEGEQGPEGRASSGSAASATWASSSRTRWAPR